SSASAGCRRPRRDACPGFAALRRGGRSKSAHLDHRGPLLPTATTEEVGDAHDGDCGDGADDQRVRLRRLTGGLDPALQLTELRLEVAPRDLFRQRVHGRLLFGLIRLTAIMINSASSTSAARYGTQFQFPSR